MANGIGLALQGGGAHGAFTWGVLERLLEEEQFVLEGVTGTSAGAMNALMLAQGWLDNGAEGAINKLNEFWAKVAERSPSRWLEGHPLAFFGSHASERLTHLVKSLSNQVSPYDLGPIEFNPLQDIVSELTDFDAIQRHSPFKLFIAATQVRTGKIRIFHEHELAIEHIMASACLPTLQRAVVIDDEPYWDGGFSGNPAVYPLVFDCTSNDILIVQLQPLSISETPVSPPQIAHRIAEIGFHSNFLREMRAIAYTYKDAKQVWLPGKLERRFKRLRFHMIEHTEYMAAMPKGSQLDTRWAFLTDLKLQGRHHADGWLKSHRADIGTRSSFDIEAVFL